MAIKYAEMNLPPVPGQSVPLRNRQVEWSVRMDFRRLRLAAGMSQYEAALILDVPYQRISIFEMHGRGINPAKMAELVPIMAKAARERAAKLRQQEEWGVPCAERSS